MDHKQNGELSSPYLKLWTQGEGSLNIWWMGTRISQERKVKLVAYELLDPILFGVLGGLGLVWFSIESITSIYKTILQKTFWFPYEKLENGALTKCGWKLPLGRGCSSEQCAWRGLSGTSLLLASLHNPCHGFLSLYKCPCCCYFIHLVSRSQKCPRCSFSQTILGTRSTVMNEGMARQTQKNVGQWWGAMRTEWQPREVGWGLNDKTRALWRCDIWADSQRTGRKAHKDSWKLVPSRENTNVHALTWKNVTPFRAQGEQNKQHNNQLSREGEAGDTARKSGWGRLCGAWQVAPRSVHCLLWAVGSHWRVLSRRVIWSDLLIFKSSS